ncbi:Ab-hydrolase associated lipase region protein (macronuclear) [Tetrahymena thermophila SB210]|uniref:Lipase n=1 Tax=Tetrahymena thermophila (strain SB210) TaxID=312017 RepID=Q22RL6_TETTS|nr:Ab-hydrolase associated lipase region protein [Tetrahymena thermophila SB210]EAR88106.2 Ab-hydrolase associated lipase region protein [Tetrahymena thermophila SB210]|eukprot:XP_001008351.2 Ab-hydrolase associated lipase region protein [Tetrahymena thermophila SB210]
MNYKTLLIALCLFAICTCDLSYLRMDDQNVALPSPDRNLPTAEYLAYHKYPLEVHYVTTEDGYILKYNRIQAKKSKIVSGKKPIFLQHGLLDCSDTWIINEEKLAPAFILANAGYDVWMGNSRGNMFGRNHTTLNPDTDKAFWNFSFDEMSKYDLPAGFAYIANVTGFDKIHYVGHSQGSTTMFIALSTRNQGVLKYLDKVAAFGPVAKVKNEYSKVLSALADYNVDWLMYALGIHEVFAYSWLKHPFLETVCGFLGKVCRAFLGPIADTDPKVDNYKRMDVLVGHDPAGTSLMNMEHWKQMVKQGNFQAYDYGAIENLKKYHSLKAPLYDLTKIQEKVYLFAGSTDSLADPTDVAWMRTQLPNFWFKEYNYGHCTFMWGISNEHMDDLLNILQGQDPTPTPSSQ